MGRCRQGIIIHNPLWEVGSQLTIRAQEKDLGDIVDFLLKTLLCGNED